MTPDFTIYKTFFEDGTIRYKSQKRSAERSVGAIGAETLRFTKRKIIDLLNQNTDMGKTQKVFFMPGEEMTEEAKQKAREFAATHEAEKAAIAKASVKEKPEIDFMNVNFEPFEDRVLVYPDPVEAVTAGGIYKPEEAIKKDKPVNGTVVRVGPGKAGSTIVMPIKPGDRISYGNYAGTEFKLNDVGYLIMRFADIFGKI